MSFNCFRSPAEFSECTVVLVLSDIAFWYLTAVFNFQAYIRWLNANLTAARDMMSDYFRKLCAL